MSSDVEPGVRPRVWPAIVIVALQLGVTYIPGWLAPMTMLHFMSMGLGPMAGGLALLIWWTFASRTPGRDRLVGLALAVALGIGVWNLSDASMPQLLVTFALPGLSAALAVVLILTAAVAWSRRRWLLAACLLAVTLPWTALRVDGMDGDLVPSVSLRWSPTREDDFLAARVQPAAAATGKVSSVDMPEQAGANDWPGFRGAARDGRVVAATFATDWQERPPRELWRRRVGPGWSSFAVVGDAVFTQEQRGQDEVIVCYALTDGREVWAYVTPTRFEEAAGGPGPRSTPTFDGGGVYAVGANGTVHGLHARTGQSRWKRDLKEDVGAAIPTWGFSSSPVVAGKAVIVFAGAGEAKGVVAYDRDSGEKLWVAGDGALSYSSGHFARIGGIEQVLMATDVGLQALGPETGDLVWQYRWETSMMPRIVQPLLIDGGKTVIVGTGYGIGSRRLDVQRGDDGNWNIEEKWTSRFLKPYFNDFVHYQGHCYGFDGNIFTCIGVDDGKRRWKGGRYGHGQVVMVVDLGMLLVITERGEVVLVEATPAKHREVTRFKALEGKTWNHPVITRGRLLVRNDEEAACFELPAP